MERFLADRRVDRLGANLHEPIERGVAVDFLAGGKDENEFGRVDDIDLYAPWRVVDFLDARQLVPERQPVKIERGHMRRD